MDIDKYNMQGQVCMPTRETIRERLVKQRLMAVEHLANLESALKFMDENPNFENFHNLVSKIGF